MSGESPKQPQIETTPAGDLPLENQARIAMQTMHEPTIFSWGDKTIDTAALFKELKLRKTRDILDKIPATDGTYDALRKNFSSVVTMIRKIEDIHRENKKNNDTKPTDRLEEKLMTQYTALIPALKEFQKKNSTEDSAQNPASLKADTSSATNAVDLVADAQKSKNGNHVETRTIHESVYLYPPVNTFEQFKDLSKLTFEGLDMILESKGGSESIKEELRSRLKDTLAGIPNTKKSAVQLKALHAAHTNLHWAEGNLMRDRGHASDRVVILSDIKEFTKSLEELSSAVNTLSETERAALTAKKIAAPAPQKMQEPALPTDPKDLSMSGTATASFGPGAGVWKASVAPAEVAPEKKAAPETFAEIQAIMDECNARIRTAAMGNPAAIITAKDGKYVKEYQPLLVEIQKIFKASVSGYGMYGEKLTDDAAATISSKLDLLNSLSTEIAADLKAKVPSEAQLNAMKAREDLKNIPPAPVEPVVGTNLQTVLTAKQMFNEQFRGTKDLEKGRDAHGKWFVKEKGKLGEDLGKFYTRGIFARMGARVRTAFGMKAAGLPPELQAQKSAALEAAKAYSASIEEPYAQRLGRELKRGAQNGGIDLETFNIRMAQFRSMTANRFVFQTMDMVHTAETAALSDQQKAALGKATRWYGKFSKAKTITLASAAILSGAAVLPAAYTIFMTATGLGALAGKKVNDRIVTTGKENVRDTVMDIGRNYEARNIEAEQAAYKDSLHELDRRKTAGVVAGMVVGGGLAGGGTILAEHLTNTFAAPDLHSHLDAIPKPVPEVHHDAPAAIPKPVEVPAAPEMPHIALAPNAGHLYHPVLERGETVWVHAENFFSKELHEHFISGHDRDLVLLNLHNRLVADHDLARQLGIANGDVFKMAYQHTTASGEFIKGDTLDDTLLGKLVNEEIGKLAAKVGTPMEQATGTHIAGAVAGAHEAGHNAVAHSVATPSGLPPVPGSVLPVKPDALDITHAQPIPVPLPESNTPYVPVDVPQPAIPTPMSTASEAGIAAGVGALGAGVLSARENSRVVGRAPNPAEVQQRKQDIIRLIEKPEPVSRIGRFFGSLSQTDTAPQTPYEVLKNMSVTSVAENLAAKPNETASVKTAREGRKAAFVRENRIDAKTFEHWLDNFELWKRIVAGSDTKISDSMTFDTLLEKISEYQLEHGETLQSAS